MLKTGGSLAQVGIFVHVLGEWVPLSGGVLVRRHTSYRDPTSVVGCSPGPITVESAGGKLVQAQSK